MPALYVLPVHSQLSVLIRTHTPDLQAPIAVYTSGKGSSAAGLTATVIRSSGGDFYLEARHFFISHQFCLNI